MTTVAYRDGVMVADRRAYSGTNTPIGSKTKITRLEDGTLVAASSRMVGAGPYLAEWVRAGCVTAQDTLKPPTFELLVVRPGGAVFYAKDELALTGPLEVDYIAMGSGGDFAMGALAMGADARRAVEVAAELDPWTGNGLDEERVAPC